jgi:hypothetical protein
MIQFLNKIVNILLVHVDNPIYYLIVPMKVDINGRIKSSFTIDIHEFMSKNSSHKTCFIDFVYKHSENNILVDVF